MTQVDNIYAELKNALSYFPQISMIAGNPTEEADLELEILTDPHKPSALPKGKMAVYGFHYNGVWLKVGKAGPNSKARYLSQHYHPKSSSSNLAKSIIQDAKRWKNIISDDDKKDMSSWMKSNLVRFNILLDASHPKELLSFLEAYLHLKLKPVYEG